MSLTQEDSQCDSPDAGRTPADEIASRPADVVHSEAVPSARPVAPFPRDIADLKRLIAERARDLRFTDVRNDLRLPDDPPLGTAQRVIDDGDLGFRLESGPRRHYLADRHYRFDATEQTVSLLVDADEEGRRVVTRITLDAAANDTTPVGDR